MDKALLKRLDKVADNLEEGFYDFLYNQVAVSESLKGAAARKEVEKALRQLKEYESFRQEELLKVYSLIKKLAGAYVESDDLMNYSLERR